MSTISFLSSDSTISDVITSCIVSSLFISEVKEFMYKDVAKPVAINSKKNIL